MTEYKLYYFINRGRAEAIRHLFKIAGVQFVDEKLNQETWPPLKNDMPIYQVPVLDVNGTKIGQSVAVLRFLGNEFGLTGKSNLEKARLDMIAEVISECNNDPAIAHWPYVLMGVSSKTKNKEEYFRSEVRPAVEKHAQLVEKFLLENGNNGLFLGDKETWVDIYAAETFSKFVDFGEPNALEAFPHIKEMIDRIHNLPAIKKHLEEREKTVC